MYTFRYNPVFKQWVAIGHPLPIDLVIRPSHLLDIGRTKNVVAATYPHLSFTLDLANQLPAAHTSTRLYDDAPAVGEYELLLAKTATRIFSWKPSHWEEWLSLVQLRILQTYHNPLLHHVSLTLHTDMLDTVAGYQRVGDLVVTSHPITGEHPVVTEELIQKIAEHEELYKLEVDSTGFLYVPSAPTAEHEVWYLPVREASGVEEITKDERKAAARSLALLFSTLHAAHPREQYVLTLYTSLTSRHTEAVWWIRVHRKTVDNHIIPVRSHPEVFLRRLRHSLGHPQD